MTINVGVCAMTIDEFYGVMRIMGSSYAIDILTLLIHQPYYRTELVKLLGKSIPNSNYHIAKMKSVGLIEKERSVHTDEVDVFGRYVITPLGRKAFDLAVKISVELNLPKNKLLLTSAGKVRLLK